MPIITTLHRFFQLHHKTQTLPVVSILLGAVCWGMLWLPLKYFSEAGLTGNLIGMTAYSLVGLVALPIVWHQRALWRNEWKLLLLIGFFFGMANITFTSALMGGEVVRVMLLFYLLPAWGALGGVCILKEKLSLQRKIAIALSLLGVFIIMGGTTVLDQPFSMADLMALSAGFCLSASGVVNKKALAIPMASRSFIPFIFCPPLAFLANQWMPTPMPDISPTLWVLLAGFAFVWLFVATLLTTYGVTKIEASRASILQVTELFVAIISAVWIGDEILTTKEYMGGALIVTAALIEAFAESTG